MTALLAGRYLQLRREAAGLTVADVAAIVASGPVWRHRIAMVITAVEAGEHEPQPEFVARLRTAFRFDVHAYFLIALGHGQLINVCAGCGCSELDACLDDRFGACAWTTPARDECNHCARKAHARAA